MNEDNYKLVAWERYWLPDNGVYGPIGSKPNLHVETNTFERMTNPMHPWVLGYILHNDMPGNYIPCESQVRIHEIGEAWTQQEKIDHAAALNKRTREEHGKQ